MSTKIVLPRFSGGGLVGLIITQHLEAFVVVVFEREGTILIITQ